MPATILTRTGALIIELQVGIHAQHSTMGCCPFSHLWQLENPVLRPVQCADAEEGLRAGAYAVDITPQEFPVSSNGNMSDRQATVAHDPLHARCLVLHNGEASLAIVVCDSCMILRATSSTRPCSPRSGREFRSPTWLMSATHAHSAVTVTGVFQSEPESRYREFLVQRIADGIEQAHKQYQLARIGWTIAEDPTQVFNRRWFTKAGVENKDPFGKTGATVRMNPGFSKEVNDRPSGPIDPQIGLLAVQNLDGTPIALLANYSPHAAGGEPKRTACPPITSPSLPT
ncbi:MAG: hypothetical protein U0992_17210 [Planctomycetaceae bacterium]